MKNRLFRVSAAAVAVLVAIIIVSPPSFAQTPTGTPGAGATQRNGNGNGTGNPATCPMANGNGAGAGMMNGRGAGYGPEASLISVAADQLHMTVSELTAALGGTKSIAQVAAEHNVQVSAIVDAFLAPRSERLAQMVEAGRLTQAQADQMLATMRTNVTEQINEVWQPNGYGNGNGAGYVDADGDGVCDNMENGTGMRGNMGNGTGNGPMMGNRGQGRGRP